MNMLDMHTREQANKIHLDNLHHEAKTRFLLRGAKQDQILENRITRRKLYLKIAFAASVIIFGSLLLAFAMGS
jgi:hypothetical protein